jgi:archaellin
MRIVELILDDEEITGIEAISVVENPAIEEEFIALKNEEIKLAEVSSEKRILLGALLIPNKPIYRRKGEEEYYIYFSKDTVLKASQLYLQNGNQSKATLEHQHSINGLTLVESWIVEDETHDKSRKYGLNVPVGTWMGAVKVNNEQIWEQFVKTGKVKGFSIEGYFADKMERPKEPINDFDEDLAQDMLKEILSIVKEEELESYSDYPSGVKNNAKRGIELNEKVNNKCATDVGKIRAQQLAQGKAISKETIKRMYSFLSRAEEYYDESDTKACGTISYLLWGGKAGKRWAESKLKELGEIELESMVVNENIAIIDDRVAFNTKEKALEIAKDLGCEGYHEHEFEGQTWYMPCKFHKKEDMAYHKCPKGYEKKDGKCVKMAEVGKRGGIKRSKKAPKSDTPNPNPKGKGTAKGDASTTRGAKVSKKDEATLKKKSDDFNKRYKDKLGYGVTVGMLKSVFQRGLGAFNTSHSPKVKSPSQWAFARVNAFLYLVKNGRPQNAKYTTDNDLLPKGHPKK